MKLKLKEIALFALLGVLMFTSKKLMEFLPNIHLVGTLTVAYTAAFRSKALFPIYVYVFLDGLFGGFGLWWYPYLYIWTVLWAFAMLIPQNLPKKFLVILYISVCGLHGFLFGVLYSPFQALAFGLDFKGTINWIIAGIPFDVIHGVSNLLVGTLIFPIASVLKKAVNRI
ncbi:MAG: hypothetical protein IJZ75_05710 [Clostridia bacterium]|nr:hypothetical protein [Clostridia bacterium]